MPADLLALSNLGPTSVRWLVEVGIERPSDLETLGAVEAYRRIRGAGLAVSLNLLYALHGALWNVSWIDLPAEVKADLRQAVRSADEAET
ncbi:MAG: TfoX/Sxy family protein [Acidobacteriota bacterium]